MHCLQCVRQTYSTTACRHGSEYTAVCHRRLWTAVWPAAQRRPTRSHCHLHCTSTPPSDCTGNIQFTLMSRFGEMYRCVTCSPMDPVKKPILGTQINLLFPRGTIISVTCLWRQPSVFVYAAAMFSVMCSYNTSKPEQYYMLCMLIFTVRGVAFDRLFAAAMCLRSHHYYVSSCHIRVFLCNYIYKRVLLRSLLC